IREEAARVGAPLVRAEERTTMVAAREGTTLLGPATQAGPQPMTPRGDGHPAEATPAGSRERRVSSPARPARQEAATLARGPLRFSLTTPIRSYTALACPLPGRHQLANALLAVRAAEILAAGEPRIDARAIAAGLAAARW